MLPRALRQGVWLVFWLAITAAARSEVYRVGDLLELPQGVDQHSQPFVVKAGDYRAVIFDTPGEGGDAEPPKDPKWFDDHHALLLVNISEFSAFKKRMARGRMESKPFRILVVEDPEAAARFPRQKGKFTVLRLDDKGVITGILYAAPGKELQDLFAPAVP